MGQRAIAVYSDELPIVIADEVDGWVLLAENNGWHGAKNSVLQWLSAGTVVASAFWNLNRHSMVSLARDGEVLAEFDFVIDRERPAALVPHLDGLEFTDPYRTGDISLPQAYRRVLELRWERSRPLDPAMDISRTAPRGCRTPGHRAAGGTRGRGSHTRSRLPPSIVVGVSAEPLRLPLQPPATTPSATPHCATTRSPDRRPRL